MFVYQGTNRNIINNDTTFVEEYIFYPSPGLYESVSGEIKKKFRIGKKWGVIYFSVGQDSQISLVRTSCCYFFFIFDGELKGCKKRNLGTFCPIWSGEEIRHC